MKTNNINNDCFYKAIIGLSNLDDIPYDVRNALMICIPNILGTNKFSISNVNSRLNSTVGYIDLNQNKLFFKISSIDRIKREIQGKRIIKDLGFLTPVTVAHATYENLGVMIQERLPIADKFTLSDIIADQNPEINIAQLFDLLRISSTPTLIEKSYIGVNDIFFHSRILPQGRIYETYQDSVISLHNYSIPFLKLLKAKFIIDGVEYRESFEELIVLFRKILSPKSIRPMWLSHGDLVESNIYYNQTKMQWGLLDLEVAGLNWTITDLITPLIGFAYMFDYTLPNYSQESLYNSFKVQNKGLFSKKPMATVSIVNPKDGDLLINIDNIRGFEASNERKIICYEFFKRFFVPTFEIIKAKEHIYSHSVNIQIRAALFMRLFGTHSILNWNNNDQARSIGLIIKLCGTEKRRSTSIIDTIYGVL